MSFFTELLDSLLRMPVEFGAVAASDPISAVLLAVGGLLTLASVGVFGYLSARGVLAALLPPASYVTHRPE
jgi:hypothetical protein